jgi:hypothetical protein
MPISGMRAGCRDARARRDREKQHGRAAHNPIRAAYVGKAHAFGYPTYRTLAVARHPGSLAIHRNRLASSQPPRLGRRFPE